MKNCRLGALGLLVLLMATGRAWSCIIAVDEDGMAISGEDAVIVWDAAAKRQHFIRRGIFRGKAKDFGFLVPTPTMPELAAADKDVFRYLNKQLRPPVMPPLMNRGYLSRGAPRDSVDVLLEQRVGDFDAVVLAANDTKALDNWLAEHGYSHGPQYGEWLEPYLKAEWKITAFKIARDVELPSAEREFTTTPVRMSFATERPYYPYREPEGQRKPSGLALTLYVISNEFTQGTLADDKVQLPWKSATVLNRVWPSSKADRAALANKLALQADQLPGQMFVTVYRDFGLRRRGLPDLTFERNENTMRYYGATQPEEWIAGGAGEDRRRLACLKQQISFLQNQCVPLPGMARPDVEGDFATRADAAVVFQPVASKAGTAKEGTGGAACRYVFSRQFALVVRYDGKGMVTTGYYPSIATPAAMKAAPLVAQIKDAEVRLERMRRIYVAFQQLVGTFPPRGQVPIP